MFEQNLGQFEHLNQRQDETPEAYCRKAFVNLYDYESFKEPNKGYRWQVQNSNSSIFSRPWISLYAEFKALERDLIILKHLKRAGARLVSEL